MTNSKIADSQAEAGGAIYLLQTSISKKAQNNTNIAYYQVSEAIILS